MKTLAALVVTVVTVMLAAAPSWACAVCGTQKDQNDWAFELTTALLSLLPPLMMGGLIFFIVRMVKKNQARDDQSVSTPD